MVNATPITTDYGFNQLGTNMFNASLTAWRGGEYGFIAVRLAWGFLPLLIAIALYARTKNFMASLMSMLISAGFLHWMGVIDMWVAGVLYTLTVIGMALALYNAWASRRT